MSTVIHVPRAGVDGTEVAPAVAVKSPPELAVSVLSVFPSCARFDLAVGLQSREETASLLALLKLLSTVEACAADVPPLAAAYKCTL